MQYKKNIPPPEPVNILPIPLIPLLSGRVFSGFLFQSLSHLQFMVNLSLPLHLLDRKTSPMLKNHR